MTQHLETGKQGELAAAEYLIGRGFRIMARNYWKPYGEIDIVAEKEGAVHFVEVKSTRVNHETGEGDFVPEDHMNPGKLASLKRVIQAYAGEYRLDDADLTLDLACVYLGEKGETLKIELYEDVLIG